MTPADLRLTRKDLGWEQRTLARIVGVRLNTVSRWELGHCPIPGAVVLVLRLAQASRENQAMCEVHAREKSYRTKTVPDRPLARSYGPTEPCFLCKKVITRQKRMIHVIDGGSRILHPDDEELYKSDSGDMQWLPIGPDCAKRLGLEWSIDIEKD